MKKKSIKKQVVKALAVGISASMALQPMAVFAEGEAVLEPIAPAPVEGSAEEVPATTISEWVAPTPQDIEGKADAAQEAADVVSNDVETNEETGQVRGDLDTTIDDTETLTEDVFDNSNIFETPGEAGPGVPFGTDAALNVVVDAAVIATHDHAEDAKADIESAKKDLIVGEIAEAQEERGAQDAAKAVNDMQTLADATDKQVDDAIVQANEYVDGIKNATTRNAAQTNYNNLVALAGETEQAVIDANSEMEELNEKYDAAKAYLVAAQMRFEAAINGRDGASADVAEASREMKKAHEEIHQLQADIAVAEQNIERHYAVALEIVALQEEVANAPEIEKSEKQDQLFITVIEKHYADQFAGKDAKNVKVEKSDSGYFTLSYEVPGKSPYRTEFKQKYYTYEVGENGNISFRLKSAEQVAALDYAAKFEAEHKISLTDEQRTVYKTTEEGRPGHADKVTYYTKYELENRDDVVFVDGQPYFLNGKGKTTPEITIVGEDNLNSLYNEIAPGETKEVATGIVEGTEQVSYEVTKSGRLLKHTTATVNVTEYKREQTEEAEYKKAYETGKGRNKTTVNGYTEADKKAAQEALEEEYETIVISKIVNKEKTFFVVSGTYTPTFVVDLDAAGGIYKRAIGGYNAKNKLIDDIDDDIIGKFWYDDSKLTAQYESDVSIALGYENYKLGGKVVLTRKQVSGVITSDEFVYSDDAAFAAAIADLKSKMKDNLGKDGYTMSDVVLDSYKYNTIWRGLIPKVTVEDKEVKVSPTEDFILNQSSLTVDDYKKYSYYIDYIKKVGESTKEGELISTTEYKNAKHAIEILQNSGRELELIDKHYQEYLDYAKDLLDKYQRYAEEAEAVHQDIKQTQKDLKKLDNAIDRLNDTQKAGVLLESLLNGATIADYFGISELPEEEKREILGHVREENLENISVRGLIRILDRLKVRANNKLLEANEKLGEFDDILATADEELQKALERLPEPTPGPGPGPGPAPSGPSTTEDVITTLAVVNPPAAEEEAAVLGEQRRVSRRRTAATVEEVEAPAETQEAPAVQEEQKAPEKTEEVEVKPETTIEDADTAKAAAPIQAQTGFPWWILIIVAAVAGVSVEEIVRRRNAKAKANSVSDTTNKDI
ncbi:hypothetical protein [Butyrivibrio sp. FCS014]|uniref:hypothetical protein n=1 Tax=Butyrivibrio sp. FCS014 TaxID=1408304 RepID=UPI000463813A|nr:hypothetical protein [Butyrivibrio sp. FCS014]